MYRQQNLLLSFDGAKLHKRNQWFVSLFLPIVSLFTQKRFGVDQNSAYFCNMMILKDFDLAYSTDIHMIEDERFSHCIFHIICMGGEGSFVYNESCFHINKNDLIVISRPDEVKNIAVTNDFRIECFAANTHFLRNSLPQNNYSIRGSMSLYQDPIIPLSVENTKKIIGDIRRLRDRLGEKDAIFYREIMESLCLTMIYDIFEFHTIYYRNQEHVDHANYVVNEFLRILSTGITRTQRDASYFANQLHVSLKYLSRVVKRATGETITSYIDRATIPILRKYLDDERLSLTQISDIMNFTSLSYFSRYCSKHLGMTPSKYRSSKA